MEIYRTIELSIVRGEIIFSQHVAKGLKLITLIIRKECDINIFERCY